MRARVIPAPARKRRANAGARLRRHHRRLPRRQTLPSPGLLSTRSSPSEQAYSGFTQLPAADGGAEPGRSGKSFSPGPGTDLWRRPSSPAPRRSRLHAGRRNASLSGTRLLAPAQLLVSRNQRPRPLQPVLQLGGEEHRELCRLLAAFRDSINSK